MKWNHLPTEGGLFDQDPELLERFQYIFAEQNKYDKAQQDKQERQASKGKGNPRARQPRRR